MTTADTIEHAIKHKLQLFANYKGYYRELCPHLLGYKGKTLNVLSYQFGGESKTGEVIGWKCMDVSELDVINIGIGEWHTADNHSRPSSCVEKVIAMVEF